MIGKRKEVYSAAARDAGCCPATRETKKNPTINTFTSDNSLSQITLLLCQFFRLNCGSREIARIARP